MALKEFQQRVDDWVKRQDIDYWEPLSILARLVEETGELAREVNHRFGQKKKRKDEAPGDLPGEIADIIFTLCCLANPQGIDLGEAFDQMMEKLEDRDNQRWKNG